MAYIDLNPIRAGISHDLESSDFTSVKDRIQQVHGTEKSNTPRLMPFSEVINQQQDFAALPFNLKDCIDLVDWTGRCVRKDKRGFIEEQSPHLITTLGISQEQWQYLSLEIQTQSISMLHGLEKLAAVEKRRKTEVAA